MHRIVRRLNWDHFNLISEFRRRGKRNPCSDSIWPEPALSPFKSDNKKRLLFEFHFHANSKRSVSINFWSHHSVVVVVVIFFLFNVWLHNQKLCMHIVSSQAHKKAKLHGKKNFVVFNFSMLVVNIDERLAEWTKEPEASASRIALCIHHRK